MLRRVLVVAMMAQTASAFLAPSLALVGIASAGKVASMLRSSDVSRASGLRMVPLLSCPLYFSFSSERD